MTKIVINRCHGGFSLSDKAAYTLLDKKGFRHSLEKTSWGLQLVYIDESGLKNYSARRPENRADPDLIQIVENMGDEANGGFAELLVVEIPDGVEWQIEEYDGLEWIAEKHRTWP